MYHLISRSEPLSNEITSFLKRQHADFILEKGLLPKKLSEKDVVVVIGDDNLLLETFRILDDREIPVLGIAAQPSFLMQLNATNYERGFTLLKKGKFSILRRARIEAAFHGHTYRALNDIGIFPAKSASLTRYSLFLNNQLVWKDTADGMIVSTPTGSTGYSFSAHGPIILDEPPVLSISAISSTEKKAPIIISNLSKIMVGSIQAQNPVVIMDGDVRINLLDDAVHIQKSSFDALFIQFSQQYVTKMKKIESPNQIKSLPPSAKLVYKILSLEGNITQKELIGATGLPDRTVRHALQLLERKKLITARPNLNDARQTIYGV